MSEWKKVKLGELCDITSSKRCLASERSNNGIPFYCSKEIILLEKGEEIRDSDYIPVELYLSIKEKYGVPITGDLLLTTRGTNGIPYIYKKHDCFYFADGNLSWFKNFKSDLDVKYLYYWFKSDTGKHIIDSIAKGTAQKAIPIDGLRNINISIPSIRVQCKISEILSRYDSLIENYQKQIKLLEESAQRLYKEWFVDLRFPGHENTKIVDGVPEGWEKVFLTELIEPQYGKDHKSLSDGLIPLYGSGGIMRYVNQVLYSGESVLIPRKGSLNNIMLVSGNFWTIDTMFYSKPLLNYIMKLVYFYLKGKDLYMYNVGAAVPSMTVNILSKMDIILPDGNIRKRFDDKLSLIFNSITNIESQIHKLTEARDRLLPKLMNGEIEV